MYATLFTTGGRNLILRTQQYEGGINEHTLFGESGKIFLVIGPNMGGERRVYSSVFT